MNQTVESYRKPDATPVSHAATRVEIRERQAWSVDGWFGVPMHALLVSRE